MGRYNKYEGSRANLPVRPWRVHPIWRGIGCLLLVLLPLLSYAGAAALVQANREQRWLPAPAALMRTVELPLVGAVPGLYANLLVGAVLMLIGFAAVMVIYALVYRAIGPAQYAPPDSPPLRRRRR